MPSLLRNLGNDQPLPQNVVDLLQTLPGGVVYLTGSQWLGTGTACVDSDWDFFADYNDLNCHVLLDAGYNKCNVSWHVDPSVVEVWAKGNVHVQLVKDAALKSKVQDMIRPVLLEHTTNRYGKNELRLIWQTALLVAAGGEV